MPDLSHRLARNVPGPYYVDDSCTDCDLCRSVAPAFFTRDDDTGYSYVHRQPVSSEEIAEAEDARTSCPAASIGKEGTAT